MKTIMARTPHESSFSFSKRYFNWRKKDEDEYGEENALTSFSSSQLCEEYKGEVMASVLAVPASKKKLTVSRFQSILTVLGKHRSHSSSGLGTRMVGTLFGYRRGHVHFAFQEDPKSYPAFMIELSTPTSALIREMASGLVRIALECDKKEKKRVRLLEEPIWRTYCNGKKCGVATRHECGLEDSKVLKALEPISMGAGVFPGNGAESEGELMYMRAKFERVVGSRDSEAFYMTNLGGSRGPELSIFFLRV